MTDTSTPLPRLLPADRFHAGVRVATLLMWFASIVVAYVVLGLIATKIFGPLSGLGVLLLLVVAVVAAQPIAWLGEKQLLARWPSGRAAELQPDAVDWRDGSQSVRLELGQQINYWRWRFLVRRRRGGRVPGNHYCFAVRLLQGDSAVALYTFLSPTAADALAARYAFYELRRPKDPGKTALGGRDSIYLAAEYARWDSGAELDPPDFEALVAHLAAYVPEFARSAQSGV